MPTVADPSEALAAESQEKTVGNWGAIRCYKRCRRVGGTVSNCHAACPSNTETEVAGDISACDEAIEATMQDGSCCPYDNARWDWSKLSDHPEECCEGIVSMDNPNECPPVCNEATEATMKDGSCCPYDNARWDWSNPTVVPDHPEECCEGIVSMDNPNECPAVETPPAYTVGDKGKRARGCPDGYEAIKNGEECKAALKFLKISRKGVKNSSKKACYKGKNGRGYNNGNAGAGASYICKVEGNELSQEVNVGDDCAYGTRQSPIDLPSLTTLKEWPELEIDMYPNRHIKWEEFDGTMGWFVQGGIQRWIPGEGYGPFWELQYMTVVAESEHTIEGKHYDAELQFFFESQEQTDTLTLSILLEEAQSADLRNFWFTLTHTLNPRNTHRGYRSVRLDDVFSQLNMEKYYRYQGSSTKEGCLERTDWIVMGDVLKVDPTFLAFLKLKGTNSPRETQDRNGRMIEVGWRDSLQAETASESSSSMVNEAIGSMGTQQFVKLFALIGAASIMFHGAKIVYKGLCTSNEEFHQIK